MTSQAKRREAMRLDKERNSLVRLYLSIHRSSIRVLGYTREIEINREITVLLENNDGIISGDILYPKTGEIIKVFRGLKASYEKFIREQLSRPPCRGVD